MNLDGQRIGIYARHSTEKQNPRSSEDQIDRCLEWAQARGGAVSPTLVFRDDALTGQTTSRPGLQAMLRAAEAGKLDVLVVEDLSVSLGTPRTHTVSASASASRKCVSSPSRMAWTQARDRARFCSAYRRPWVRSTCANSATRRAEVCRAELAPGSSPERRRMDTLQRPPRTVRARFPSSMNAKPGSCVASSRRARRAIATPRSQPPSIAMACHRLGGRQRDSRKRRVGWAHSGVRSMLHNERYVGVWTFGARRWVRHPVTGKRVPKPGANPMRTEMPDTRIVDERTWEAVVEINSRTAAEYRKRGGAATARTCYPLSTLLRCAICGGPMVVNNSQRPQYRCDASRGRGGLCGNRLSAMEVDVRTAVLDEVVGYLGRPEVVEALLEIADEEIRAFRGSARVDVESAARDVDDTEKQIANLLDLAAGGSAPASLLTRIRDLEDQAQRQRARLGSLRATVRLAPSLPEPQEVVDRVQSLRGLVDAEPRKAREAFQRLFTDEGILMHPQPDGAYLAPGGSSTEEHCSSKTKRPAGVPGRRLGASVNAMGCGGR